jgi:hypothetical protein
MHLITTLIYVILLFGNNVELILLKDHFRLFVQSVATIFHSNWRENFLAKNPFVKNRFKLTHNGNHYNPSDFIYPMILTVGSCLVHRNLKVARNRFNSSLIYVDILNMEYNELPSDWAYENRATAQIACSYVLGGLRRKRLFNQNFIDEIAEIIHIQWMIRNKHHASKELMVPYANLTEIEKDKDRKAVLIACRVFNERFLFRIFNTTPIHFIGRITPLN